jgi:hypothetical protein
MIGKRNWVEKEPSERVDFKGGRRQDHKKLEGEMEKEGDMRRNVDK